MTEANPNDAPRLTGLVLLGLFLVLVGVGVATVVVPELRSDPEREGTDAGVAPPP